MGVLPARPDRDRDRGPAAHAAPAAPEGTLSRSGEPPADLRDQLAQVGTDAVRAGLVVGSGGNLSAREPGADECWVTGTGTRLDQLGRADFARVRIADGAPVDGAVTDHTYYLRPVVRVGFHPPGSMALARAAAAAVAGGASCVILAHHGCSVLGGTVELAHKRVRNLEEAAWLTYRALALGRPDVPECPPFRGPADPAGAM